MAALGKAANSLNSTPQRVSVIMAGGSGERFWPLSRKDRPKQLLRLTSETETMLHEAVNRIAPLIPPEHVYVVTAEHLVAPIRAANVGIPAENVIAEPCKRNTAGCLSYAAAFLLAKYQIPPDRLTMAVTTADHVIGEPERFRETVRTAMETAERHDCLATLGVTPARPETGYGYIQISEMTLESASEIPVFRVEAFHEKPDDQTAGDYVAAGNYYWNSGMFFWKVSTLVSELERLGSQFAGAIREMEQAFAKNDDAAVRAVFERLESISVDFELMEKTDRAAMVQADFPWDDVGEWTSLERSYPKDEKGNIALGDPIVEDCTGCIVYNEAGGEKMAVGVVGAENLVVVVSDDAVLVISKDRAQDVRKVVDTLKDRDSKYL